MAELTLGSLREKAHHKTHRITTLYLYWSSKPALKFYATGRTIRLIAVLLKSLQQYGKNCLTPASPVVIVQLVPGVTSTVVATRKIDAFMRTAVCSMKTFVDVWNATYNCSEINVRI